MNGSTSAMSSSTASSTASRGAGSATATLERPSPGPISQPPAPSGKLGGRTLNRWVHTALVAAVRSAATVAAGLVLTCGIALFLWAMTPTSADGASSWLRGAANTYLLAHFADLRIGSATLTATPLLLTAVCITLLVSSARFSSSHSAPDEPSAGSEGFSVAVGALTYGGLVTVLSFVAQDAGVRDGTVGVWAGALAAATLLATTVRRGTGLRVQLELLPDWCRAGFNAALGALAVLVAGAATVFIVAMVTAFPRAADLSASLADDAGAGLGLALVGVGFVPNAIAAGLGYVTGAGFQLGAGRYSPFGSVLTDLPPLPLLAAAPTTSAASPLGLATLAVPLAAAVVASVLVTRRVTGRTEQLQAVALAAGSVGAAVAVFVALGSGGVTGGAWAALGANGLIVGGLAAASLAVVGATWVLAPYVPLPGRPRAVDQGSDVEHEEISPADGDSAESDGAESDGAESDSAESDSAESDSAESDRAQSDGADSDSADSDSAESAGAELAAESGENQEREGDADQVDDTSADADSNDIEPSQIDQSDTETDSVENQPSDGGVAQPAEAQLPDSGTAAE